RHQPDLPLRRKSPPNTLPDDVRTLLARTVSSIHRELKHAEALPQKGLAERGVAPPRLLVGHRQIEHRKEPHGAIPRRFAPVAVVVSPLGAAPAHGLNSPSGKKTDCS